MKTSHKRLGAAVATLAVVGTSVSPLFSGPATAASAKLPYTCQVPTLGNKTFTATLDTSIADLVALNDKTGVNATMDLVIPGDVTKAWYDAGYRSLSGTAKVAATQGTTALSSVLTLASVNLPQTGTTPTPTVTATSSPTTSSTASPSASPSSGTPTQSPSPAPNQSSTAATDLAVKLTGPVSGLKLDASGDQVIKAGAVSFALTMKKADSAAVVLPEFTCTTAAVDTTVDKFAVTTQSTLAFAGRTQIQYGQTAQVEALVGTPGAVTAGNVKFILNGVTTTVPVTGGKAILPLPKPLAIGTHTVQAEFSSTDPKVLPAKSSRTVRVVKDRTDTFVRVRGKKSKRPRILIGVDSVHDQGVTGSTHVRVKRRGKMIIDRPVQLHSGDAVVTLPRLQAGRYRIHVRYTGSDTMRPSGKRFGFKVNRRW